MSNYIDSIEDENERNAALREEDNPCEGHESLDGAHMGETVYCDGSCKKGKASPKKVPVSGPNYVRRAIISVAPDELAQLIDLPEGLSVHSITHDWVRDTIIILVEGDQLEEVPRTAEAPYLGDGIWHRVISHHDDKVWTRWEWQKDEED